MREGRRAGRPGCPHTGTGGSLRAGLLALVLTLAGCGASAAGPASTHISGCSQVAADFKQHRSGIWAGFSGRVTRLLADAHGRYTHQRFITACASGQTIEVVNDISIGTRVPVVVGGQVTVRGQYIWNDLGGLVHFTHHDPEGGPGGWIRYGGRTYQ